MRMPFDEIVAKLTEILEGEGFVRERANRCARLVVQADCDGVFSHGVAGFPHMIKMVRDGLVDPAAEPEMIESFGAVERWDGHLGIGPWNAWCSMNRAIELAREQSVGCVALRRTNHWRRGGNYGWQAAEAGMIGICWTNTMAIMPAWGGDERKIGNNPLVLAVPRSKGPVVLDIAMSQFSFGKLGALTRAGKKTSVPGGYDKDGNLSSDPETIRGAGGRALPIGYWKGSGLAVLLDLIAAILSGGRSTLEIGMESTETSISQVFIAFDAKRIAGPGAADRIAEDVIADIHKANPLTEGGRVLYPGERSIKTRRESEQLGVEVDENVWANICALQQGPQLA